VEFTFPQNLPPNPVATDTFPRVRMPIRLIKHEVIPKCGSYEIRFADGRPSRYFYFEDDLAGRRVRSEQLTRDQALDQAKAFARAERDR
jgi:hypothetical protein